MSKFARVFVSCLLVVITALGLMLPVQAADTKPLIAVLPFDDGSIKHWWWNDWDVGKGVSDLIINAVFETGKFRVVERQKLDQIIAEQDFGASGRVDQRSAAQIGKILGAKYFIMGKVTEFTISDKSVGIGGIGLKSSTARVSVDGRMIDTTTGEMVATGTGKGEKSQSGISLSLSNLPHVDFTNSNFQETILGKATIAAVNEFAVNLTGKFAGSATAGAAGLSGKVAAVAGSKVYLNVGSADGVKAGMVFSIERVVEEVKDPDTGEVLDVVTDVICEITISEVKDKSCNGTITKKVAADPTPKAGDLAKLKK